MEAKKRTGGFTLIELIVVIAILGILAGVGTVAYTGYVQRTNKHADQQLVADVVRGIILESYASPSLGDEVGMVILTDNGASVQGDPAVASAMANNFGKNWQTSLSLRYNWGKHTQATQAMLNSLKSGGSNGELGEIVASGDYVSYAAKADELFGEVESLANKVSTSMINGGTGINLSASQLLAATAGVTANSGENSAQTEATRWQGNQKMDDYYQITDPSQIYSEEAMMKKLAGYAGNCARTYAFAEYVSQNAPGLIFNITETVPIKDAAGNHLDKDGNPTTDKDEYTYKTQAATKKVETYLTEQAQTGIFDVVSALLNLTDQSTELNGVYIADGNQSAISTLRSLANQYTSTPVGTSNKSQAYIDGLGYYALMNVVNDVSNGSDGNDPIIDPNASSSDYFDQASSHVSLAGLICSGQASVEDLEAALSDVDESSDNNVVVTVYRRGDRQLQFLVDGTEAGAYVQETINSTITGVDVTGDLGIMFEKTTLTLDKGNTESVGFIVTGKTDGVTYEAVSSDPSAVTATVSGNTVSITGVGGGTATITLTATNSAGDTASAELPVTVKAAASALSLDVKIRARTSNGAFKGWQPTILRGDTGQVATSIEVAKGGTITLNVGPYQDETISDDTATATINGTEYSCTIQISVSGETLSGNSITLPNTSGQTVVITVTLTTTDGSKTSPATTTITTKD